MTKIICISDTHGYHSHCKVPAGDILIHAGDCTDDIGMAALREFLIWFEQQPCPEKILIAGNHDGAFEKWPDLARQMVKEYAPSVHYLQDSEVNIGGLTIWGSPYTPTFFDWYFMRDRGEKIRHHWDLIPDNVDVLVTHGPPFSQLDLSNHWNESTGRKWEDHLGCRDLWDAVQRVKPQLHVFGHIHGSGGRRTYTHDDGWRTEMVNASQVDEAYIPNRKPIVVEL